MYPIILKSLLGSVVIQKSIFFIEVDFKARSEKKLKRRQCGLMEKKRNCNLNVINVSAVKSQENFILLSSKILCSLRNQNCLITIPKKN